MSSAEAGRGGGFKGGGGHIGSAFRGGNIHVGGGSVGKFRRQDAAAGSFERFLHKRDILFHVALEIGHLDLGDEKDWSGVLRAEPLDRGDAKPKTRQDG